MEHTGNKTENTKATALITAVHRERYEILVEQETSDTKLNARLKTGVYCITAMDTANALARSLETAMDTLTPVDIAKVKNL